MTKKLIARVLAGEIVDTKNYRYITKTVSTLDGQYETIIRLPIGDLGTTAALNGWETVWSAK